MGYKGKIGLGLGAFAMCLLMVASGSAAAVQINATHAHNAPAVKAASVTGCGGLTFVTVYSAWSFNNTTDYGCSMVAKDWQGNGMNAHGWSLPIWEVYCSAPCALAVTITDQGWVGDNYALWTTTDSTFKTGWGLIGTTPEVKTGSALVAPSYNSKWTGTGTKYSSATFDVYFPAGIAQYLRVYDALFGQIGQKLDTACGVNTTALLASGCSATGISVSGGWSPAAFGITWKVAP
jgi:hypothetical protein